MADKIKVGLLFGGRSAEHEISLVSARYIYQALDKDRYDITLIGIDKTGSWCLQDDAVFLLESADGTLPALSGNEEKVTLVPGAAKGSLVPVAGGRDERTLDVVFPVLHGPLGEDGTVQGFLRLAGIPFVGADILGSAVGMDKEVMKRLFKEAGVPACKYQVVYRHLRSRFDAASAFSALGTPLFVKPANMGSSVGVHRVESISALEAALDDAFKYDRKVLIEEAIAGRELECAVLGNEDLRASVVGEIIPDARHGFYSYESKYLDEQGAALIIPAEISESVQKKLQNLAVRVCEVLCCEGMARVDFFLTADEKAYVNEVNTIPGFTSISMYPKLWEASGLAYRDLLDELISLAIKRHERDSVVSTVSVQK